MRRLVSPKDLQDLDTCTRFATAVKGSVQRAALEGIAAGLAGRRVQAPAVWSEAKLEFARNPDPAVASTVRRLGAIFRDASVIRDAEATVLDETRSAEERLEAARLISTAQLPESLSTLQRLLGAGGRADLRREVLRGLGAYDRPEIPELVLAQWQSLDDALRTEAQTLLTGRRDWAHMLLEAIARRQLDASDLSAPAAQRIAALKDPALTAKLESTWGSIRQQTPGEIDDLIKKMRRVLASRPGNATTGRDVFEKKCAICHKFNGQGASVGPDITGADRSPEYLLINILDPNRVVGQPYYTHVVATKGGRVFTGKLVSDSPSGVTLQGENDKVDIIAREDIEEHAVKNVSVMPEGLPKDITDDQFRDLIEYLRRK
jgi:putative heme-binding domain-containing protein